MQLILSFSGRGGGLKVKVYLSNNIYPCKEREKIPALCPQLTLLHSAAIKVIIYD